MCGRRIPWRRAYEELYPALAEKYATTPGGVEGYRNAIVAAWETGNRDAIIELCGPHAASECQQTLYSLRNLLKRYM